MELYPVSQIEGSAEETDKVKDLRAEGSANKEV